MASIDSSYVRQELKAIIATSKVIEKLVHNALTRLEANPESFPLLEDVPRPIRRKFPHSIFRKVYIEHDKHSFRLVVIHWRLGGDDDHVDIIYAFPRKDGYAIDWDWVETFADDDD